MATTLLYHFCLPEVDVKDASGLFTIQGELEDLPNLLGQILLVAVMKDNQLPAFVHPSVPFLAF